ncbi:MTV1, partial [Symbiodinium sp. KB8]
MTHASIQDCEKLATLLIARLAKNDCNVKYKTLLVIKVRAAGSAWRGLLPHLAPLPPQHVARLGRSEFKRLMQRQVDTLKQNLRAFAALAPAPPSPVGPPHPLKGDAPNKRVRDTAEEAIKAVFESESASTAQSAAVASRMTGLGSDGTTSAAAGAAAASPAPAPVRGGGVMRSTASPASGGSGMAAVGNCSPKAKPAGGGMLGAVKGLFSRATG